MAKVPFQLSINPTFPKAESQTLLCTTALRIIPERREVYQATWKEQPVIVKLFLDKISAGRHLKKEWKGLTELQKRNLSAPKPFFYGRTQEGGFAIVSERIADSSTVWDLYQNISDGSEKLKLLTLVCRELAKQHTKGVLQNDLHLGNFLLSGDKIFAIDPGQMKFLSGQLTRKKSISQLASLAGCLPEDDKDSLTKLCREYARLRKWTFDTSEKVLFDKKIVSGRKKGIKRALKKSLRTSKRYLKIKTDDSIAVFNKSFCQSEEAFDFIRQIDAIMDKGHILKDGRTCYVSRLTWNSKDVVVKRYNNKGLIHSLRHTIKRPRAFRGWLHSHRLGMLNILTPKPLAYIENHRGPIIRKSYQVTEFVKGPNLYNFLRDDTVSVQQRSTVIDQLKKLLEQLGKHHISHGDLKHSNILITENGPVLTDLDAMKVHLWKWFFNIRKEKDALSFKTLEG